VVKKQDGQQKETHDDRESPRRPLATAAGLTVERKEENLWMDVMYL